MSHVLSKRAQALAPVFVFCRYVARQLRKRGPMPALLVTAMLASGCASESLSPRQDLLASPVESVGHYGAGIVVTEYSIGGFQGGRVDGWGGGGSLCCVLVPRDLPTKPFVVSVKWETDRQEVDERRQHEATVPVNFEVPPGKSGGIFVHFLPGHRVELWVSDAKGRVPYGGPPFPRGPEPLYRPLQDEKPWPSGTTAEDVRTKMAGE